MIQSTASQTVQHLEEHLGVELIDRDQPYRIVTAAATSSDGNYAGKNAADVSVTTTDDDTAGITVGSISGALYGALFIQFIPNVADEISKDAPWAIFGLFLIAFVYVMPAGVAGAVRMALARL